MKKSKVKISKKEKSKKLSNFILNKKVLFFITVSLLFLAVLGIKNFSKKNVNNNLTTKEKCLFDYRGIKVIKDTCGKFDKLYRAADIGFLSIVKQMVEEEKVPVNLVCSKKCKNWTSVMIAAANGHLNVVKYLISKGADVNFQNKMGRTALHFAVRYNFFDITEELLKADANPYITDFNNNKDIVHSPMQDALVGKENNDMLKLLIKYGADVNYSYWEFTPLIQAVVRDDIEFAKILIKKKANPFVKKTIKGKTLTLLDMTKNKSVEMQNLIKDYVKNYKTESLKDATKQKIDFIYVTKTKDGVSKVYDFYYDGEKYFTVTGDLQSVIVNKNNPTKDFYIHLDDKLIIYPEKTSIDVGYDGDFRGRHNGSVWIGKDKNIYKTILHHFDLNFDCSEDFLKLLNEKYKLNLTGEKCREHKERGWGSDAVCVKYKYNKETKLFEQVNADLTKTEACDTIGCWIFTYDNLDKNYVELGGIFLYGHKHDEILEKKIYDKLKKLKLISHENEKAFFLSKTQDLIVTQKLSDQKIFVFDHNLNLKTTFDINLNNSDFEKYIYSFFIIKDELFILTKGAEGENILLYDLKTLKLIKKFDNLAFFSFMFD